MQSRAPSFPSSGVAAKPACRQTASKHVRVGGEEREEGRKEGRKEGEQVCVSVSYARSVVGCCMYGSI